ncbi:unnamed protein product [marine sediment metagenome]|uniref:Uncharacterized protein n=1 Tax=marine sediment metagenome TaxID=412755 RepID=X0RZG0_9ZZZZ
MPAPVAAAASAPVIAGLVIGAVGVIAGFLGSKKASKAAKKQADLEAEQERLITGERIREIGREERQLYGETVAGYTQGGVLSSFGTMSDVPRETIGSAGSVLTEQQIEFQRERSITEKVGASKVASGLARGKATASAYKWQGYSNAATGISNILANYSAMTG